MMSSELAPVKKQLGKIVRLLSSDQDGDVVAAARALMRTLKRAGLDIHVFAEMIETKTWSDDEAREMYKRGIAEGEARAESKRPATFHNVNRNGGAEPDWPMIAEACLKHRVHKSEAEAEFCSDMQRRCECGSEPTPKQAAWLQKIYSRRPAP